MFLNEGFLHHSYVIDCIHESKSNIMKLERLQIKKGSIVKIVKNDTLYPFILEVEQNRIAIDIALIEKMEVTPYV